MTYKTYTHNYLVKNSNTVLENASLRCTPGSDNIHSLAENQELAAAKPITIVVPGFINLHCHLAYSQIKLESQDLFSWLKELYHQSLKSKKYSARSNVLDGIDDLLQYGTTYVVENCFSLKESFEAISQKKIKAVIGLEVFGSDPSQAQKIIEEKIQSIEKYSGINPNIELCLSPHAVYDVSKELWQECVNWSKTHNKILLSHIAETEIEEMMMKDFTQAGLESAKAFWQSIGTLELKEKHWQTYKSSVDFLAQNNLLFDKLVLAHGVYCSEEDLANLAKHSVKLINCPRSNKFLKNARAKTEDWQKFNIEFAMGTDSKASNYNLDLRAELMENQTLTNKEKFDKLTITAAKILGKDHEIGSLEPGKAADFVVLELIDLQDSAIIAKENIFDFILNPAKTRVREVYVNNEKVY